MLIGELARLTGVSPRALRHYEDQGLLVPVRTTGGYRDYSDDDIVRVAQIRAMIAAGMGTSLIRRYLDCARSGDHGVSLEMCPDLRAELDSLAQRLSARRAEIRQREQQLRRLAQVR
ncbi:MAG: MerR family transcriptional regulator [Micropruina sp.]|uniref:MerR family transcriptional regulator n=1 Tax=Micropruina sp. TaxID=2737536 RepID=UPI0039E570DB